MHGLIGPNGAGKSTLIGIASGFIKPFTGQVLHWPGPDIFRTLDPARIARLGLSRTFQHATPISLA